MSLRGQVGLQASGLVNWGITQNTSFSIPPLPKLVRNLREQGYETALIGKTHWHPHAAGVDLREQHNLLEHLGFNYAEEIAGPRALAEVSVV